MEPKRLTILRILDVAGTNCNDPVYLYSAYVLNTTITQEKINNLTAELALLRADAAAKDRAGAGTAKVLEKIDEAQRSFVRQIQRLSSSLYQSGCWRSTGQKLRLQTGGAFLRMWSCPVL